MKKSIVTAALCLMVGLSTTFANIKEAVNEKVMNSFKKEFVGAQEVNWENGRTYAKATFKLNDQILFAYYSQEGQLLAVTRNLVSGQLPINLLADLKKTYNGYWISDLFEISSDGATNYYVTLESADFIVVLKSAGSAGWEVFKKDRKNS